MLPIVIGLFVVLALGVGIAAAVTSGGSESVSVPSRAEPETAHVSADRPICENDVAHLLAAIAAMPPSTQAHVVENLSTDLSNGLGRLVQFVEPSRLPPAPDSTTLGALLARLDPADQVVIVSALPTEHQPAVVAAARSAADALSSANAPVAC
jgi:hypothetical protein